MWKIWVRWRRRARSQRYLKDHPDDATIGAAILLLADIPEIGARDVEDTPAGRELSQDALSLITMSWERAWSRIVH